MRLRVGSDLTLPLHLPLMKILEMDDDHAAHDGLAAICDERSITVR